MRILDRKDEIAAAQARFASAIRALSSETIHATIGFQSGNTDVQVHWLPSFGIWAFFGEPPLEKSPGARYWNVFGLGKPRGLVPIVCEINPPKRGINRQAAGAFGVDTTGRISVFHRGIFNAGGRVPLEFTKWNFRWNWDLVQDGNRNTSMIAIGEIDAPQFPGLLRDFVLEVARFKETARSRPRHH